MKKSYKIVVLIFFVIMATVAGIFIYTYDPAVPLSDVDLEPYSVYHEFEDYTLWRHTTIEPQSYITIGYGIGSDDLQCTIGMYHTSHFLVEYDDELYDILEADKLNIYNCSDLFDIGFIIEPYSNIE